MSDSSIYDLEGALVVALVAGYGLALLLRALRRQRRDLTIAVPLAVALGVRITAAIGVSLTPAAQTLRGGDELGFLANAHLLANQPVAATAWTDALTTHLYEFFFAAQLRLFDGTDIALRITQSGLAVIGLALLAVAVYDLAGPRAAVIAAWILALDPSSVFFSTLLHKEPLMFLAEGLVAFGGARLWSSGRISSLGPMVGGGLVALTTRSYAGWFLVGAAGLITLHASLRHGTNQSLRSLGLLATVAILVAVTAPTIWHATSNTELSKLQSSQNANASDQSNLQLERVDYSTRSAVITNLPGRVVDLVTRPYPWQLANASQRLGFFGTMVTLAALLLLIQALVRSWGQVMVRAGPLVYLALCLLVAYSLSAGNAGTGFRYRTHVIAVVVCLIVVLRIRAASRAAEPERQRGVQAGLALAR